MDAVVVNVHLNEGIYIPRLQCGPILTEAVMLSNGTKEPAKHSLPAPTILLKMIVDHGNGYVLLSQIEMSIPMAGH